METNDRELEELLTGLPREQPSSGLDVRVAILFGGSSAAPSNSAGSRMTVKLTLSSFWPRLLVSGLAMAACLALAVIVAMNTTGPTGQPTHSLVPSPIASDADTLDFKPVRIEQVWSQIQPGDVITLDDNTPLRRFQRQTVEHVQLIDDKKNIRIEYTRPRQDTIVMPVRYD